jgi:phospholipase C
MNTKLVALAVSSLVIGTASVAMIADEHRRSTLTPITHLVVLFDENRPFDHYFGTYPHAENRPGEAPFRARLRTPRVNGFTRELLDHNPNLHNPIRLGPSQAVQCSQIHNYDREQRAADQGRMDQFVEWNGATGSQGPLLPVCDPNIVMSYFDGNTVTALWNYAQHFAMSDNHFASNWGSSAVGTINLVSGSPFANRNFVDHTVTDQSSIIRFIEDNWQLGRIGDQSFDARAGSIENMFDFSRHGRGARLFLDPATGQPVGDHRHDRDDDDDGRGER